MNFLTAEWKHLLFANYRVEPGQLSAFVPEKTELDLFNGGLFISLVAFLFDKTKVLNLPIPFHRTFEEVNLRFYVKPQKNPSIRAVTFIKEIVPKPVIPIIANSLFHENYVCLPMNHQNDEHQHWYSWQNETHNQFWASVEKVLEFPAEGSLSEFITEHYWGYTKGVSTTLEYRVQHPKWKCCEINNYKIDVDFSATYGEKFAFLNKLRPQSVLYAEGSAVSVSFPGRV